MLNSIKKIAAKVLGLETLVTRNSDSLDFHELSVWQIKQALEDAYQAGREAAAADISAMIKKS